MDFGTARRRRSAANARRMTRGEISHDRRHHHRRPKIPHRPDKARAVAGRGVPDRADPAADGVACALRLHRQGAQSDAAEFHHAVFRSRFPRSVDDDGDHRHHVGHGVLHRRRTYQLAGVAHRPAGPAVHPRAGDGVLRDAALPRRGGVGAAGSAEQRDAEQALPLSHRRRIDAISSTSIRSPA